jgi:hypothetical protein
LIFINGLLIKQNLAFLLFGVIAAIQNSAELCIASSNLNTEAGIMIKMQLFVK